MGAISVGLNHVECRQRAFLCHALPHPQPLENAHGLWHKWQSGEHRVLLFAQPSASNRHHQLSRIAQNGVGAISQYQSRFEMGDAQHLQHGHGHGLLDESAHRESRILLQHHTQHALPL